MKALLEQWPSGLVATSAWLRELSISAQLVQRYLDSEWIEAIGRGAYRRSKDEVEWPGGLAAMQSQLGLEIHLGGLSALSIRGVAHYARLGWERVFIFSAPGVRLPKWFRDHDWGNPVEHVRTSFLPAGVAMSSFEHDGFHLEISSRERAVLECLYLSPARFDLMECYHLTEGLLTIRPEIMQELLVSCTSIRVKRLFLYMADKARLPVLEDLSLEEVELGSGDRAIVPNGTYDSTYGISVPRELADHE